MKAVRQALAESGTDAARRQPLLIGLADELAANSAQLRKDFPGAAPDQKARPQVVRVLNTARTINDALRYARLSDAVIHEWDRLRDRLNAFAAAYNLPPISQTPRARNFTRAEVERLIRRVEERSESFEKAFDRALNTSPLAGGGNKDSLEYRAELLAQEVDLLRRDFDDAQRLEDIGGRVSDMLIIGQRLNIAIQNVRLSSEAEREWDLLRADLNALAEAFGLRAILSEATTEPQK
ncbi:MAG TPA: hypothetical protein VNO70_23620 [Blastocatellia bacterium]|nr:hypothetical protein [Blastocatellia bacterium]